MNSLENTDLQHKYLMSFLNSYISKISISKNIISSMVDLNKKCSASEKTERVSCKGCHLYFQVIPTGTEFYWRKNLWAHSVITLHHSNICNCHSRSRLCSWLKNKQGIDINERVKKALKVIQSD